MEEMKIVQIPIESIVEYENNVKIHTEAQIEQIKKSIQEFGNCDPVAVDENNILIEGHGRVQALKSLGAKTVPAIILRHLNENQKKAYRLIHNKLTMNTDFDLEGLAEELGQIDLEGMSMSDFDFVVPGDVNIDSFFEENQNKKEEEEEEEIPVVCPHCGKEFTL